MLQDLRFGFKLLWKEKAFTVTALLTLALCIGANTAIFSVIDAALLRPLPYPEPERLAQVMLDEWLIAPGALFHATHRPTTLMRINFATTQDARFWKAFELARQA